MSSSSERILVTGASGFIGARLCSALVRRGHRVKGTARRLSNVPEGVVACKVGQVDGATEWRPLLRETDVIVHLAAQLTPDRHDRDGSEARFFEVNASGTENLARQAAEAGVRRFVFVSTVKVHGETTSSPLDEASPARPADAYARSKCEAERRLHAAAAGTAMATAITRPPLVYGPGSKANVFRLIQAVAAGMPLPFGLVRNRRSLVSVDNLVDLLCICATDPRASGQIFFASDGEDVSSAELVRTIAKHLGRSPRLLPVPPALLKGVAALSGQRGLYERLCGSLQVDIGYVRRVLGWAPPFTLDQTMAETVAWYRARPHREARAIRDPP